MTKSRGVRGAAGGCAVASLVYLLARGLLTLLVSALMGLAHPGASLAKPLGFSGVSTALFQLLIGLGAIVLTLVLVSVGEAALDYAIDHFGLPVYMAALWQRLRFPVMGLVMYFALYFLYALPQDTHLRARDLYPGVLAALLGWMVTAYLFSWYVENFASYSLFYGSIGAVIVLLIWLNFTAAILILGAELNGTLIALRKDKALRRQEQAPARASAEDELSSGG